MYSGTAEMEAVGIDKKSVSPGKVITPAKKAAGG
jgi:hypothetical protein